MMALEAILDCFSPSRREGKGHDSSGRALNDPIHNDKNKCRFVKGGILTPHYKEQMYIMRIIVNNHNNNTHNRHTSQLISRNLR